MRAFLLTALIVAWMVGVLPGSASAVPFQIGFTDFHYVGPGGAALLDESSNLGADVIRIPVIWRKIAVQRPVAPADPGDPAYEWSKIDAAVRGAADRGLTVLLGVYGAPDWAEGPGRPKGVAAGAWRPDATAYGQFARAIALRYSGRYADLPPVEWMQSWNEPNLGLYLAPQWVRDGGDWTAESPRLFRSLQNAFYAGVKNTVPSIRVLAAGTAPFGDPQPGGSRIQPVLFWRDTLCLNSELRRTCREETWLDAIDHHPYSVRGPDAPALNADDVSVPDIGKIRRVINAGRRLGTVQPSSAKPFWATEVSWDSSPPDPSGVPEARHAAWVARTLDRLWAQQVSTVLWFQVRDADPKPSYATTYQSGILFADGSRKAAAEAFQFPFTASRAARRRVRLWGMAPRGAAAVKIQRAGKSGWKTVVRVHAGKDRVFVATVGPPRASRYRAVAVAAVSRTARLT